MLIAQSHVERSAARADGQRAIPELAGRDRRAFGSAALAPGAAHSPDLRLDARAHLSRRAEVPVRGRQTLDPLMGPLEVVVLDKERQPALAVLEVGEHRPREQLVPQRLPEPLDLPAGLRVMRPALHMRDAVTLEPASNSVVPRQAVYCRPWSVRISRGAP